MIAVLGAAVAACGGTPAADPSTPPSGTSPATPAGPSSTVPSPSASPPSVPTSKPSTQEPVGDQVKIDISIRDGKVDPSGKKIDVPLGATVILNVVSDEDDELHAHVGSGDGYSLEVPAGEPTRGQFTAAEPGSFEIESHRSHKIIAILNVR